MMNAFLSSKNKVKVLRLGSLFKIKKSVCNSALSIHLPTYIESIKAQLRPPVGNKLIYSNELQIMIVGGPNQRKDFHIEEGEVLIMY